nr:succinate dehydrogenase assembly factor 2, mitochondrial-like isoform X2 [Physcomitrium patens]|eukprot:XP_024399322.1 succinate dehydrogenase assembly factor 2, mitochondrial-like isoform X2 [Physcomitrella patens]
MASRAFSRLALLRTLAASSTDSRVQPWGAAYYPKITRFYSSVGGDDEDKRKRVLNRILYRSRQRGYLELDLLLGKWAEDNINNLDENRLQELVDLLEGENPDLWNWLTGQAEVPAALAENSVFAAIKGQIAENLSTYSSPQTRAQPGKPWVRGWDDNRKIGGPQAGNQ